MSIEDLRRASEHVSTRADRIADGQHVLALATFEEKATPNSGMIYAADLVVIESSGGHRPGDVVGLAFFTSEPVLWKREKEWAKFNVFVREFTGHQDMEERIKQVKSMLSPHMPGRGVLIKAVGRAGKPRAIKEGPDAGKMGPGYVEITFAHYPGQTPESIAKVRAYVDERMPVPVAAAPVQYGHPPGLPQGYAGPIVPLVNPAGPPPQPVWNGTAWVMPVGPPPGTPQNPAPAGAPHWAPPTPPQGPPPPWAPPPTPAPQQALPPGGALLSQLLGK